MQQSTLHPCRHHHGRQRALGHEAGPHPRRPGTARAPRWCGASSRPRRTCGIGVLTLYAFSADNWRRPKAEVGWLMRLFREYLRVETARCVANGVRLEVIGRRDRIGPALRQAIEETQRETAGGAKLLLRIALDYSSRDAILRAAQCLQPGRPCRPGRRSAGCSPSWTTARPVPEVDLLIRTGGERRLSDFLLWEAAYAELLFVAADVAGVRSRRRCGEAVRGLREARTPLRRPARRGRGLTMTVADPAGTGAALGRGGPRPHGRRAPAARAGAARRRPWHRCAGARPRGAGAERDRGTAGLARAAWARRSRCSASRSSGGTRRRSSHSISRASRPWPRWRPPGSARSAGGGRALRTTPTGAIELGGRRRRGRSDARVLRHRLGLAAVGRPSAPGSRHRHRPGGRGARGRGLRWAPGAGRPGVRPAGGAGVGPRPRTADVACGGDRAVGVARGRPAPRACAGRPRRQCRGLGGRRKPRARRGRDGARGRGSPVPRVRGGAVPLSVRRARLVRELTGLSYAEYARRGFFELVAVAALSLPLLLVADWSLDQRDPAPRAPIPPARGPDAAAARRDARLGAAPHAAVHGRVRPHRARFYTTAFMGWLVLVFGWFVATVLRGRRERFGTGALLAGWLVLAGLNLANPDAHHRGRQSRPRGGRAAARCHLRGGAQRGRAADVRHGLAALRTNEACAAASALDQRWHTELAARRRWTIALARAPREPISCVRGPGA